MKRSNFKTLSKTFLKGNANRPTAGCCYDKQMNPPICALIPVTPIGQSHCWPNSAAATTRHWWESARNNKLELRQNPRGNTWCQLWACHCFEGTWTEERVNACVWDLMYICRLSERILFSLATHDCGEIIFFWYLL